MKRRGNGKRSMAVMLSLAMLVMPFAGLAEEPIAEAAAEAYAMEAEAVVETEPSVPADPTEIPEALPAVEAPSLTEPPVEVEAPVETERPVDTQAPEMAEEPTETGLPTETGTAAPTAEATEAPAAEAEAPVVEFVCTPAEARLDVYSLVALSEAALAETVDEQRAHLLETAEDAELICDAQGEALYQVVRHAPLQDCCFAMRWTRGFTSSLRNARAMCRCAMRRLRSPMWATAC